MPHLITAKFHVYIGYLAILIFSSVGQVWAAQTYDVNRNLLTTKQTYFSLGLARTYPTAPGLEHFKTRAMYPTVAMRYLHDDTWLIAVGGSYKVLTDTLEHTRFALFSIYEEISYLYRLHFPHFVSIGARLYYLNPVERVGLPLARYKEYEREIGAAVNLSYIGKVNALDFIECKVERWRGVNSMLFHAWEFSISYNMPLNIGQQP